LGKTYSNEKNIENKEDVKPDTKTAASYIIGFILFGFIIVKAITIL
jgi:hypothetical protein